MKRPAAFAALLFAAAFLSAAWPQKNDVEITLKGKRADAVSREGVTLTFLLGVKNADDGDRDVVRYDYRLIIGRTEYIRLDEALEIPIRVPAKGEKTVALPVKFTYANLYAAVPEADGKDRIECQIVGALTLRDDRGREKRAYLAYTADFPVYRGFDVKFLPFEAKELTMGGADMTFKAALVNPNGFELKARRTTYAIFVADIKIAEGTITAEIPLPARGEGTIAVPMLLDFFETGRPVFTAFDTPPAPVRLQGQVEAVWDWGVLTIPFDKAGRAGVTRIGAPAQNQ